MTQLIGDQIERFAPGFRDQLLARHTTNCAELELKNAKLIGGSKDRAARHPCRGFWLSRRLAFFTVAAGRD